MPPPTKGSSQLPMAGRRKMPMPSARPGGQTSRPASRITVFGREEAPVSSNFSAGAGAYSNIADRQPPSNGSATPASQAAAPLPDFSTSITVAVRCRGRNARELKENSAVVIETDGIRGKSVDVLAGGARKSYSFDTVFSAAADQRSVFEGVVANIVDEVLSGLNCTIFAYGQTGTGKTYTMTGDISAELPVPASAGIIPRVFHYLFGKLDGTSVANERKDRTVKCSYIELYNEELRDLLAIDVDGEQKTKLKLFDERQRGRTTTVVQGQEELFIDSAPEGIEVLRIGSNKRETAATESNSQSSRSHAVFTITVYQAAADDVVSVSKLHLVDLAGSENIQRSGAEDKRAAEAGLINRSLLTLGRVINSLVDGASHVPYRESKLTRLLQDSLGGHTKTCMIATVSPAQSNLDETLSTLDYAFRAKNIRNAPQFNAAFSKRNLFRDFAVEIGRLKGELNATRQRNGVYLSISNYEQLVAESESRRIEAAEASERANAIEEHVQRGEREITNLQRVVSELKSRIADTEEQVRHEAAAAEEARQEARREAEAAAEALAAAEANIDSLDGSLRRRAGVEAKNRARWQRMRRAVADGVSQVDAVVQRARKGHTDAVAEFGERLSRAVNRAADDRVSRTVLDDLIQKLSDQMERILPEQADVFEDIMSALKKARAIGTAEATNQIGQASADTGALVKTLQQEINDELENLGPKLEECFSEVGELAARQGHAIRHLSQELMGADKSLVELAAAVKQQVTEEAERRQQETWSLNKALVAKIVGVVEKHNKDVVAHQQQFYATADKALEDWDSSVQKNVSKKAGLVTEVTALASQLEESIQVNKGSAANVISESEAKTSNSFVSASEQLSEQQDRLLKAASVITHRFADAVSGMDVAVNVAKNSLSSSHESKRAAVETMASLLNEGTANLQDAFKNDSDSVRAVRGYADSALKSVSAWGAGLDEVADRVGSLVSVIDEVSNSKGLASASARATNQNQRESTSGWEEYIPSGKTPIRGRIAIESEAQSEQGSPEEKDEEEGPNVSYYQQEAPSGPTAVTPDAREEEEEEEAEDVQRYSTTTVTTTVPLQSGSGSGSSTAIRRTPSLGGLLKQLDANRMMFSDGSPMGIAPPRLSRPAGQQQHQQQHHVSAAPLSTVGQAMKRRETRLRAEAGGRKPANGQAAAVSAPHPSGIPGSRKRVASGVPVPNGADGAPAGNPQTDRFKRRRVVAGTMKPENGRSDAGRENSLAQGARR